MLCAAVDVSDKWGEKMSDLIRRSDAIEVLACEMYAEAQSQGYEVDSIEDFMPEAKAWMNDAPSADRPQEDTVSRRYLLAEIDDLADEFSEVDENGLHGERWCGILDSKGIIVNAPSVSDRPQGYYIKGENGEWYCSICKRIDDKYSVARFCWHCGARMKGANDENV